MRTEDSPEPGSSPLEPAAWPGAAVAAVWVLCAGGFLLLLGALDPQESHVARAIVLLASLVAAGLPIAVTWRWLRGRSEEGRR